MELNTPRLRIREWTSADAQALFCFESRPSVTRWQQYAPKTFEACQRHIERARAQIQCTPRVTYDLAVEYEGRVRGRVGARLQPNGIATLWYVTDPRRWNQGLASEASAELIRHLLDRHQLEEVRAICSVHNKASARVARKLGLSRTELIRVSDGYPDMCHVYARRL